MLDRRIWGLNLRWLWVSFCKPECSTRISSRFFLEYFYFRNTIYSCFLSELCCFFPLVGGASNQSKFVCNDRFFHVFHRNYFSAAVKKSWLQQPFGLFKPWKHPDARLTVYASCFLWGDRFFSLFVVLCFVLCFGHLDLFRIINFFQQVQSLLATPVLTQTCFISHRLLHIVVSRRGSLD